ncbi:hypothetical protein EMIHUDRAFT_434023, partial [Emiliania huxleyi CCMP1516]
LPRPPSLGSRSHGRGEEQRPEPRGRGRVGKGRVAAADRRAEQLAAGPPAAARPPGRHALHQSARHSARHALLRLPNVRRRPRHAHQGGHARTRRGGHLWRGVLGAHQVALGRRRGAPLQLAPRPHHVLLAARPRRRLCAPCARRQLAGRRGLLVCRRGRPGRRHRHQVPPPLGGGPLLHHRHGDHVLALLLAPQVGAQGQGGAARREAGQAARRARLVVRGGGRLAAALVAAAARERPARPSGGWRRSRGDALDGGRRAGGRRGAGRGAPRAAGQRRPSSRGTRGTDSAPPAWLCRRGGRAAADGRDALHSVSARGREGGAAGRRRRRAAEFAASVEAHRER